MDHIPKSKSQNYKTPRRYPGKTLGDLGYGGGFLDTTPKA